MKNVLCIDKVYLKPIIVSFWFQLVLSECVRAGLLLAAHSHGVDHVSCHPCCTKYVYPAGKLFVYTSIYRHHRRIRLGNIWSVC